MSKINKDTLDFTTKVLAASDVSELENAKQVVEHSGFDDEVAAPILNFIDTKIKELNAADNDLEEILDRKEVKDYAQSQVDKATTPLTDEISTLKSDKEEAETSLKSAMVDSIVSYAMVLRKENIDFEKVETSVSDYRKELSSKSVKELKDSLSALETEIKDAFSSSPSKKLKNEIEIVDGVKKPKDKDSNDNDNKPVVIESMADVLETILKSANPVEAKSTEDDE